MVYLLSIPLLFIGLQCWAHGYEEPQDLLPTEVIAKWTFASDEHGRSCFFRPHEHPKARLRAITEDEQTIWVMSGVEDDSLMTCGNGRRFRIDRAKGRFLRGDFGLHGIVKHYAQHSCEVTDKDSKAPRSLNDAEAEKMTNCFLIPNIRESISGLIKLYLDHKQQLPVTYGPPMHVACGRDLLLDEEKTVKCPWSFLRLGIDSSLHNIVVLKKGEYHFTGAGSNASTYVLDPEFDGKIDVKGHSNVYHLPHHNCVSLDHFRGCVKMQPDPY